MSDTTHIQWANSTGGPWHVCSEVSSGCRHCYARHIVGTKLAPTVRKAYEAAGLADWATRPVWGPTAPRVVTKGFWHDAPTLDKAAARHGDRRRFFPSMVDWLDDMPAGVLDQKGQWVDKAKVRADFLRVVYSTPNLDWLLLTKRPEAFAEVVDSAYTWEVRHGPDSDEPFRQWMLSWESKDGPAPDNVWVGASTERQKEADERVPRLLRIKAKVHFLSVEPMLERVDFEPWMQAPANHRVSDRPGLPGYPRLDWLIFGFESHHDRRLARPGDLGWIRGGLEACRRHGVPAFVKQVGPHPYEVCGLDSEPSDMEMRDPKGGDPEEWPADLRVREYPNVRRPTQPKTTQGQLL